MNKNIQEEEENEFQKLYNILINLSNKNKNKNTDDTEEIDDIDNETNNVTTINEKGRRKKEQPIKCEYCSKSVLGAHALKAHMDNNIACRKLELLPESLKEFNPDKGIHNFLDALLEKAITEKDNLRCKFCEYTFSNRGNFNKHYILNLSCNRLAYYEFRKLFN